MTKNTEFEQWERIGGQAKKVESEISELLDEIARGDVPKSVYWDDLQKVDRHMAELRSELEERMFKEHEKTATTQVFFGDAGDTQGTEGNDA